MLEQLNDMMKFELLSFKNVSFSIENILTVLLIAIFSRLLLTTVKRLLKRKIAHNTDEIQKRIDTARLNSVYQIFRYFIIVIAIGLSLDAIGINLTFLIAGSAALMVGIGLGLQQIFNDIISGFFLLFEGTVRVGDVIETEGIVARVVEISMRTSKVVTRDNIVIIIPNHYMITEKVINWSHNQDNTRFSIYVSVAYGSDLQLVKKLCTDAMVEHPNVVHNEDYPTLVRLKNFGDSGIEMELMFWSPNSFRIENIKSDIRYTLDRKFRENGITIPFPQRVIHTSKL
jgi:small-conductance mechanosensitive channel